MTSQTSSTAAPTVVDIERISHDQLAIDLDDGRTLYVILSRDEEGNLTWWGVSEGYDTLTGNDNDAWGDADCERAVKEWLAENN